MFGGLSAFSVYKKRQIEAETFSFSILGTDSAPKFYCKGSQPELNPESFKTAIESQHCQAAMNFPPQTMEVRFEKYQSNLPHGFTSSRILGHEYSQTFPKTTFNVTKFPRLSTGQNSLSSCVLPSLILHENFQKSINAQAQCASLGGLYALETLLPHSTLPQHIEIDHNLNALLQLAPAVIQRDISRPARDEEAGSSAGSILQQREGPGMNILPLDGCTNIVETEYFSASPPATVNPELFPGVHAIEPHGSKDGAGESELERARARRAAHVTTRKKRWGLAEWPVDTVQSDERLHRRRQQVREALRRHRARKQLELRGICWTADSENQDSATTTDSS